MIKKFYKIKPDGAFKVNFGDIVLNYSTVDKVEEVPTLIPSTSDVVVDDLIPTQEQLSKATYDDKTEAHFLLKMVK